MKTTHQLDLPFIRQWTKKRTPFLTGEKEDLNLSTALQPIYSLAHKRVVGHEALVRVKDKTNTPVSPAALFEKERSAADTIHLDRLCRYIHLHNYGILKDEINWLFLNVSPQTISSGKAYGSYFSDLLKAFNFPAHRIVIEVVEHPIEDNDLLLETIGYYKDLGCLIAIDDFGAGHSNFDRIWTLRPDIVKLDRSFMVKAGRNPDVRNILPGIVTLLHQAGALVLMEGIETGAQAMMAMESDVDFVQGFFFGRPYTDLTTPKPPFSKFPELMDQYKRESKKTETEFQREIHRYRSLFSKTINLLKQGQPVAAASDELLSEPAVVRCYRIGTDGVQIGHTLVAKDYKSFNDRRFKPLEDANSADWFRRHYLKRAIFHPEQLQITRPYLSITGAHYCVTLSMKFSCPSGEPAGESVLCCDLQI